MLVSNFVLTWLVIQFLEMRDPYVTYPVLSRINLRNKFCHAFDEGEFTNPEGKTNIS